MWYETIIAAHTAVTSAVSHSERMKSNRYFVWQEDGKNELSADGKHAENAVQGSTDFYTKNEFDPWADQLEASFENNGISYYKNSVQYEEDTGFYHHEWVWEI